MSVKVIQGPPRDCEKDGHVILLYARFADLVRKLRIRIDPESYEGWCAWQIANWTLDALTESHPTAADLTPHIGATLALEMAERYREKDHRAVGFRGER